MFSGYKGRRILCLWMTSFLYSSVSCFLLQHRYTPTVICISTIYLSPSSFRAPFLFCTGKFFCLCSYYVTGKGMRGKIMILMDPSWWKLERTLYPFCINIKLHLTHWIQWEYFYRWCKEKQIWANSQNNYWFNSKSEIWFFFTSKGIRGWIQRKICV